VVATIVPFDVEKIIAGASFVAPTTTKVPKTVAVKPSVKKPVATTEPVSHYAEKVTPIGQIAWRKRAQVQGHVTSIRMAPRGSAPVLEVEIWDETGGVSLQFLGRREIAGLEVGSQLRAEGMVGEEEGSMVILNPSYELLV
jgi:RecG-like helicase